MIVLLSISVNEVQTELEPKEFPYYQSVGFVVNHNPISDIVVSRTHIIYSLSYHVIPFTDLKKSWLNLFILSSIVFVFCLSKCNTKISFHQKLFYFF